MNTDKVYIPEKIKVGFKRRDDTYTDLLGYVIYYGPTGKLRKESSWEAWRDKSIEPLEYDNVPMEGFVLNRNAGGVEESYSSWNTRKTYVRVWDNRGFEIEISIPNLLYILANTSCIKGKGLEGEFVYGWNGVELVLVPTASPDYQDIKKVSNLRNNPLSFTKDTLILGARYLSNTNEEVVYLGHLMTYYDSSHKENFGKEKGKRHVFRRLGKYSWLRYLVTSSLKGRILNIVDETPVEEYPEYLEEMKSSLAFFPVDPSKTKYLPYPSYEKFEQEVKYAKRYHYWYQKYIPNLFVLLEGSLFSPVDPSENIQDIRSISSSTIVSGFLGFYGSLGDLYKKMVFYRRVRFLASGKEYKE